MIIKVDVREQELLKHMQHFISTIQSFNDLKIITENLPLGDVIIADDIEDKIIIERKSVSDLVASIKDGRYEEQSYRLNGLQHHNHNIYYLIEGDVSKYNCFRDNHSKKLTIYSAIFSLNYYKGFSVMRTFSIEETAMFICNTANKLHKSETSGKLSYYTNISHPQNNVAQNDNTKINETINAVNKIVSDIEKCDKDYVSVIKRVKKENITPENIGEIMLCQIPGISSVSALAIMEKFKTIGNLIQELKENPGCLNNISYTNTKGNSRKINKTCIENISLYLLKTN